MKHILLSLLLVPAIAIAADESKPKKSGKKPHPGAAFKKIDTNSDGSLSLDELKATPRGQKDPGRAEKVFNKMDKDSDHKLTLEEFKAGARGKKGGRKPDAPKTEEPKTEEVKKPE